MSESSTQFNPFHNPLIHKLAKPVHGTSHDLEWNYSGGAEADPTCHRRHIVSLGKDTKPVNVFVVTKTASTGCMSEFLQQVAAQHVAIVGVGELQRENLPRIFSLDLIGESPRRRKLQDVVTRTFSEYAAWIAMETADPSRTLTVDVSEKKRVHEQQQIGHIFRRLKEGPALPYLDRLLRRLAVLAEDDESGDVEPLSPDSLEDFVNFLTNKPNLCYPDIVLSPEGNIAAQWRNAEMRGFFSAEFLDGGYVRYVIFSPDREHPVNMQKTHGRASIDVMWGVAQEYNVVEWMFCREL